MTDPQETLCATCEEPADARCPIDRHPLHEALPSECRHHPFAPSSAPPAVPSVEEARTSDVRRLINEVADCPQSQVNNLAAANGEPFEECPSCLRSIARFAGAEWAREAEGEVDPARVAEQRAIAYARDLVREYRRRSQAYPIDDIRRDEYAAVAHELNNILPYEPRAESESIGDDGTPCTTCGGAGRVGWEIVVGSESTGGSEPCPDCTERKA